MAGSRFTRHEVVPGARSGLEWLVAGARPSGGVDRPGEVLAELTKISARAGRIRDWVKAEAARGRDVGEVAGSLLGLVQACRGLERAVLRFESRGRMS